VALCSFNIPEKQVARPAGLVVIAALLAWSAAGAVFSSIALLLSPDQVAMLGLPSTPMIAAALAFAITAGCAAIGLWRVASWRHTALTLWAIVANVWAVLFPLLMARAGRLPPLPRPLFAVATVPFLALPWFIVWYVRRQMPVPPA
jgi:hypothetical protein